jgi:hypothetical protein
MDYRNRDVSIALLSSAVFLGISLSKQPAEYYENPNQDMSSPTRGEHQPPTWDHLMSPEEYDCESDSPDVIHRWA